MHVRFIAEDQTIRNTDGIVWFEDLNNTMVVNTKPARYTFTNVVLKNLLRNPNGGWLLEVEGLTPLNSGTGDKPELYTIQLFLE